MALLVSVGVYDYWHVLLSQRSSRLVNPFLIWEAVERVARPIVAGGNRHLCTAWLVNAGMRKSKILT